MLVNGSVMGYFAWVKTAKGAFTPIKYIPERNKMEEHVVAKVPLDATTWELSLDELANRFPPPAPRME